MNLAAFKKLSLVIVALSFTTVATAQDVVRGQKLFKKCMSCHGKDGMGKKSQKAPMIAGQFDWYIIKQVTEIKSGARKNKNTKKMLPFISKLKKKDIKDLASFISQMPNK
jgi:cytochrome c553